MDQTPNLSSQSQPDYANLERNLVVLEKKKQKEMAFYSDIASLIAYQQMLCSSLGIVHNDLSSIVPQTRRPFPSIQFSTRPISMNQTAQYIQLLINITKLLWAAIGSKSDSAEIFINSHNKFNDMIITRNKLILMDRGPRPGTLFKEINNNPPEKKDEKNKLFSKAFTIKIEGNNKLDDSFLPTNNNLKELEEKVGPEPSDENLKSFYEDLSITEKELYNYINDLTNMRVDSYYFKRFPELSIIRELPRFYEALGSIGNNTTFVRTEFFEYSKTLHKTLGHLIEVFGKFESCFALPQIPFDTSKHLFEVESHHYGALRRAMLCQVIFKQSKIKPPTNWSSLNFLEDEYKFFERIKELFVKGEIDEVLNLANSRLENFDSAKVLDDIVKETEASKKAKEDADENSNECLRKFTKTAVFENPELQRLMRIFKEEQEDSERKEKRNNEIRENIYTNLSKTIYRTKDLIYRLSDAPVIPPTFEGKMNKLIERDAKIQSLKLKAAKLREDVKKKKEEIESLQKKSATLDKQLAKKREEFEGYKQKSADNKNAIGDATKSLEEYDKYEDLYFCLRHPKKRREVFIKGCKHSFCKKCIDIQIRERNRKCPFCQEPFNQFSDIININWNK